MTRCISCLKILPEGLRGEGARILLPLQASWASRHLARVLSLFARILFNIFIKSGSSRGFFENLSASNPHGVVGRGDPIGVTTKSSRPRPSRSSPSQSPQFRRLLREGVTTPGRSEHGSPKPITLGPSASKSRVI